MKNLQSNLLLLITVFSLMLFSSCDKNGGLLGQTTGFGANEALLNHAIPVGSSLSTTEQAWVIDYSPSRWGLVKLRTGNGPVSNEVDQNYYVTTITMFVGPNTIVPPGANIYKHPKYQVNCFDALAAVNYYDASWNNFGTAVSSALGGGTTVGNRLVVDLSVDYYAMGYAVTMYDASTQKCMTRYSNGQIMPAVQNAKVIHYFITNATTFKF